MYTYKVLGHPSVPKVKVAQYLRKWLKFGLQDSLDLARELAQRPVEVLLAGQPLEGWDTKPPMLPDDKPPFSVIAEGHPDPPELLLLEIPKPRRVVFPLLVAAPITSLTPLVLPSGVVYMESSSVVTSAFPVKTLESDFTTCQTCVSFGHETFTCWRNAHGEPKEPGDRCDHWTLNPDYQGEAP